MAGGWRWRWLNELQPPEIAIGRLTAPHGVRGHMRLLPLTDFPQRLRPGLEVYVEPPPGSPVTGRWIRLRSVQPHRGQMFIVAIEGVDSRDQAEELRSALLKVRRRDRHPLPPATYYVDDLVGMPVYTVAGGDPVGRVTAVHPGPGNDVMEVAAGERRALVPMVKQFVTVDLPAGRIVVDPIPGMLDDLLPETAENAH